ncbi:MAG TPA: cytochrome C oxidase subunit IV family protein [Alphaproteobacteria bacterium]|nr:cytochrome C oxidase subunit IV family protein [Alphaproteobacteria bacterium]
MSKGLTYAFSYLGLLALLAASVALTVLPLGDWRIALHLLIAAGQALLVALIFMQLRSSVPLVRIFAASSTLWLLIMFAFTFVDYVNR